VESIVGEYDWSTFGIIEDGPVAPSTSENFVEVSIPLSNEQLEELMQRISPLVEDGNHGCNLYIETVRMVRNFFQLQ
jgi:hypothetical protein